MGPAGRGTILTLGGCPAAPLRGAVPVWRPAFPCLGDAKATGVGAERGTILTLGGRGRRPASGAAVPTWRSAFPCGPRRQGLLGVPAGRGTIPTDGVYAAAGVLPAVPAWRPAFPACPGLPRLLPDQLPEAVPADSGAAEHQPDGGELRIQVG